MRLHDRRADPLVSRLSAPWNLQLPRVFSPPPPTTSTTTHCCFPPFLPFSFFQARALGREAILLNGLEAPEEFEDREDEWVPGEEDVKKLRVACVRPEALEKMNATSDALQNVDSEDDDEDGNLGGGMFMTTTSSSYHGHEVMKKGLAKAAKAIKNADWPLAFDEALAITVIIYIYVCVCVYK